MLRASAEGVHRFSVADENHKNCVEKPWPGDLARFAHKETLMTEEQQRAWEEINDKTAHQLKIVHDADPYPLQIWRMIYKSLYPDDDIIPKEGKPPVIFHHFQSQSLSCAFVLIPLTWIQSRKWQILTSGNGCLFVGGLSYLKIDYR